MLQICVYCASSSEVQQVYFDATKQLADAFLIANAHLIYGGGNCGLMGCLADTILQGGGKITGVIPRFMIERSWHHTTLSSLIITESIHERKQKMASLADAVVALPGGCGTLEELLEIITWKQLGLFNKPIIIVNVSNYFDPLLAMLDSAIESKFMSEQHRTIWMVVHTIDEVIPAIHNSLHWDENNMPYTAL